MEIKRDFYLNQLIKQMGSDFVKVIVGIRRCGKSYLLNTLFYRHLLSIGTPEDHIIRFAFDSAEDLAKMGESPLRMAKEKRKADPNKFLEYLSELTKGEGPYYLLLDEIGELEAFEYVLNGYLRSKKYDVYVTGSNSHLLSSDIDTTFAGRGWQIHVYPLSFQEFMSVYEGDRRDGFNEYLTYGGLPIVVLEKSVQGKIKLLNSLLSEIYIRDILKRHRLKNEQALTDLLNLCSSSIGFMTNPKKLSDSFLSLKKVKIASSTIEKYLSFFEKSFLIEKSERYDIRGKQYLSTPFKIYFTDLGLRNAQLNFRQIEEIHAMENIVYNELRRRGFNVDVGTIFVNEQLPSGNYGRKELEVDFVANRGPRRYYLQSSYAINDNEKREKETRGLKKINDSFRKIVVTKEPMISMYDESGLIYLNIYDFLLNEGLMDI